MMMISLIALLTVSAVLTETSYSLYDFSAEQQLQRYKMRVDVLHSLLLTRGCLTGSPATTEDKRDLIEDRRVDKQLEVERILYERLTELLIKCDKAKFETAPPTDAPTTQARQTTTAPNTATPATLITTNITTIQSRTPHPPTPHTTTIETTTPDLTTPLPVPTPQVCLSAINLTEPWRLDHNGSMIRPVNGNKNNDVVWMTQKGRPWFRFSGEGGDMLLNHTVPEYSCVTHLGLWTNSSMPSVVGVEMDIKVFGSYDGKHGYTNRAGGFAFNTSVIRCSYGHSDFIYKYTHQTGGCCYGFCGMRA